MILLNTAATHDIDRTEAFKAFAQQRAEGQVLLAPVLLPPEERRLYIRRTIREDHQFRIHNRPEGAQAKFDKLAKSPFTFFRGTALLYYRDQAGTDGHLPTVLTIGDVHPENFGVMPNEDGVPFFGINDFDEAYFAPFSWDLKRGAVGFYIAAKENGFAQKKRSKVVKSFVSGYLNGLKEFARDDREKWRQYRIDNSPPMIKELLESALTSREKFLKKIVDLDKGLFTPSDEIVPRSKLVSEFQQAIDQYCETNDIDTKGRAGHFKVKDVALKKDSGAASLGLDRYYVLIDGPTGDVRDDIILELKQARRSALYGLTPQRVAQEDGKAERILQSQEIHLVGGDPYYGRTTFNDLEFIVRERSPYKDKIDVDDLSLKELKEYARICGQVLAQAHARSDEDTGVMDGRAEEQILGSINLNVFKDDIVRFAKVTADRIYEDYELFQKDHVLGAFNFVKQEK